MNRFLGLLLLSAALFWGNLHAQTTIGLVAHYAFDGNLNDVTGNTANTGVPVGTPSYSCGVNGQALVLDGANDQVRIPNQNPAGVNSEFDREDFSISFYFKPVGFNGTQYLISKRDTACSNPRRFFIRYVPGSATLNVVLAQDEEKDVNLIVPIRNTSCWQQVTLVRQDTKVKLYINGIFAAERGTASRIDLSVADALYLGGSTCIGGTETPFAGLLDDVRIYNRALREEEITPLFDNPDRIVTNDTIIFQGNSIDVTLGPSCGSTFSWMPTNGVVSATAAEPTITGEMPGDFVYYIQIRDQVSTCVATDSIRIRVVDPATLPCLVAMPKAFTPNDDALNDGFGPSNPYALSDFISLEIFDRWGSRVFSTASPFDRWDATFQGEKVNPGVFLWRVAYRCNGEEFTDTGTVMVIR